MDQVQYARMIEERLFAAQKSFPGHVHKLGQLAEHIERNCLVLEGKRASKYHTGVHSMALTIYLDEAEKVLISLSPQARFQHGE